MGIYIQSIWFLYRVLHNQKFFVQIIVIISENVIFE
jgi:hypothetical protein